MSFQLDTPSIDRLSQCYAPFAQKVYDVYEQVFQTTGLQMRVTQAYRTYREQAVIYSIGRSTHGRVVTNAKPGESLHNFGLAVDSCFRGKDPFLESLKKTDPQKAEALWQEYGKAAEQFGLTWGDKFPIVDRPHIELTYGLSLKEIQTASEGGNLDKLFTFLQSRGFE